MTTVTQDTGYIDNSDVPSRIRELQTNINSKPTKSLNTLANAAGQTLTTSQLLGGILLRSGAAGVSDATPTAAALVAAVPGVKVGQVVELKIRNNNTGTLTLTAGTGVTLEGTTTIATVFSRDYALKFTNVTVGSEAVQLSGLDTAAV